MAEEKKISGRDAFKEFAQEVCGNPNFSKISNDGLTKSLAQFYIDRVNNPTRTAIDEEEFDDGWVDGKDDLDIDFINRNDGLVMILQSRYHGPGKVEDAKAISHFQKVLLRLQDNKLRANDKLTGIAGEIDWERDQFRLVYVTFAKITEQVRNQCESPQYPADPSDLPDRCTWEFLDEEALTNEYRNADQFSYGVMDKAIDLTSASGILETTSGKRKAFTLVMDGKQIKRMYDDLGKDRLFSLNIRNFLGNTRYNKGMIDTAKTDPKKFYFYNNGISCLAESVKCDGKRLHANKLQVINGAQTVKSLVHAFGRKMPDSWHTTPPLVSVRVTEVEELYRDRVFREAITLSNNSQNTIKASDFRANDLVQVDLEAKFKDLRRRHGREIKYLPKRTKVAARNTEIISLEEFAKVVYSFLGDPVAFSGSTSYLFDEERGYKVVFGDGKSVFNPQMPPSEFRMRAAIWWLGRDFSDQLKADKEAKKADTVYVQALERKWLLLFAARKLLERADPVGWPKRLERLYEGDWNLNADTQGKLIYTWYELSRNLVVSAYQAAVANPPFNHRNWMRTKAKTDIERTVATAPEMFVDQLRNLKPA